MSNLWKVLSPPPPRDLEPQELCVPCTATQVVVCIGGGAYLVLPLPYGKPGPFVTSMRGCGAGVLALGVWRLFDLWLHLRDTRLIR